MKDNLLVSGGYATSAKCDYLVCGYHSDADHKDPFNEHGIGGTLDERLKAFYLNISPALLKSNAQAGQSTASTSLIFHGVVKGVVYDRNQKPPTPADAYAHNFSADVDMEPVSVGTTPLDSVLTFLQAHQKDTNLENRLFDKGATLASQIADLSDLLYATEADAYDSRIKAADLVNAQNFGRGSQGGFRWVYAKLKEDGQAPAVPSSKPMNGNEYSELEYLAQLNDLQQQLDTATRKLAALRWSLFAQFFNYFSDAQNSKNALKYRQQVTVLHKAVGPLKDLVTTVIPNLMNDILQLPPLKGLPKVAAKKVAAEPFYTRTDPTLFIAGLDAGWPADYLKNLPTRMSSELQNQGVDAGISTVISSLPTTSPKSLIAKLLSEAYMKDGTNEDGLKSIGGKLWHGQPFCPIFVEWEAVYYNVDFDKDWDISLASSPSTNNHKQIRYINPNNLFEGPMNKAILADTRVLNGRIPVLPQPSFSLAAVIRQVLSSTPLDKYPPSLSAYKDPVAREKFLDQVTSLKFIRYATALPNTFVAY